MGLLTERGLCLRSWWSFDPGRANVENCGGKFDAGIFSEVSEEELIKMGIGLFLHFYSPIYMLLTLCDREPKREQEAIRMLESHIRQFNSIYKEEGK